MRQHSAFLCGGLAFAAINDKEIVKERDCEIVFEFNIRYNEVGGFFTVDLSIASTGEVLVYGDIVRYGRPLFNSVEDERFPVPVIMPLCLTGDDISEVTFENFGKEVRLYLWERNAA